MALTIKPNETLPEFYNRTLNLKNTILYSRASVPPTRLLSRFIDQLMTCPEIRPYLALKKAALKEHLQLWGEDAEYPVESLQKIYTHLENVEAPMELCVTKTGPIPPSSNSEFAMQAHIAKFRSLPECTVCFRRGHTADQCIVIRGEHFIPPDILCRAHQYNATHGNKPIAPLKSWTRTAPPNARFDGNKPPNSARSSFPTSSKSTPQKATIKYFYADPNGNKVPLDSTKIVMEDSTSDDEFQEALENPPPEESQSITPAINAVQGNIMPLFPDYDDMFDPLALQQLTEN